MKAMLLMTIILMDALVGMEFDLFVPSFPVLREEFNLSALAVEALLAVNFIGYCVSLFFIGVLADRYGRKPVLLSGIVIFIIGSALCLWTNYYSLLFLGRLLQGIGVAAPSILSFLIIADLYAVRQQQQLVAMLNGSMNVAAAAAPFGGSYITSYFSWQGNFFVLFVLGIIVLLMTLAFVPRFALPSKKETLSLRGYVPLLQSKSLILLCLHLMLMFTPYWIFVGISPLLYMQNLGVNLLDFGYYQGAFALVFGIGSVIFGCVIKRKEQHDYKKMLIFANYIFGFSMLCLMWVTWQDSRNPLLITLMFIPFVIGQIIPSNLLWPVCVNFIPHAKAKVSAILQGGRLLLSALALELAGYCYAGSFRSLGIILTVSVALGALTLMLVIKNQKLMKNMV